MKSRRYLNYLPFPIMIVLISLFGKWGDTIVTAMFILGIMTMICFQLFWIVFLMKMEKGEVEIEIIDKEE